MIKIALAGTSGLAQYIAHYISTQTCHQFFFLSRNPSPALTARGWQVLPVNYSDRSDVRYKLIGVDTVISTISGQAQLSLIDAASEVHVRRFVPSEFEGPLLQRPINDPLDRGQKLALARLHEKQKQQGMDYTIFTCGVFYERFYPGGMAALQLGAGTHVSGEGEYILDIRNHTARLPFHPSGDDIYICMTSAEDVARYIVAALDLPHWPNELLVKAERLKVEDIVAIAEVMCGALFQLEYYDQTTLINRIYALGTRDNSEQWRLRHLMATLQSRYDFQQTNLDQLVHIQTKRFDEWLITAWSDKI